MPVPNLVLDPSLKYWALLPISLAMVLFGLIRQQLNLLLSPSKKLPLLDLKHKQGEALRKVALFKQNNWTLLSNPFQIRQAHLVELMTNGSLLPPEKTDEEQQQPQFDSNSTDMMMNMAKNQFGNMAAQYVMMGWVNYFFAGFVLMKLPFPLTFKFKQMLQSGVATADLDVRWVSSISWYFIAILGLNSVYNLMIGQGDVANQMMQQQQQPPPMMPTFGGGNSNNERKQLQAQLDKEANDLKILGSKNVFEGIEERLLKTYV